MLRKGVDVPLFWIFSAESYVRKTVRKITGNKRKNNKKKTNASLEGFIILTLFVRLNTDLSYGNCLSA